MRHDREFETYLKGKSDLSQSYADLPPVELPDHLDAAILAEAHRAVGSRPGARPGRRWMMPLSMVATLLMAVVVGLLLPHMLQDTTVPQIPREEKTAVALLDKNMAEPSRAPAPKAEAAAPQGARVSGEVSQPSPAAENKPSAARSEAPAAPAVAAKQMQPNERADSDSGMALAKEKKSSRRAEGYDGDRPEQSAPAAAAPASVAAPAAAQADQARMKVEAGGASLRPEDSLLHIKQLKQQGKLDEAKKELAAFKKRYPDYPVPEALEIR